jgi:hypothetical protein
LQTETFTDGTAQQHRRLEWQGSCRAGAALDYSAQAHIAANLLVHPGVPSHIHTTLNKILESNKTKSESQEHEQITTQNCTNRIEFNTILDKPSNQIPVTFLQE